MSLGRLEAFSDGVFAVAITLLTLNLTVAGPGHGKLINLLGHARSAFVAYVVSFFTIGVIWVNHRSLFSGLARVDRVLLFLNLLLLLFVVAIPGEPAPGETASGGPAIGPPGAGEPASGPPAPTSD